MTIRKRYDEAQILLQQELVEPALIITLVAVAAAAEHHRKAVTGGARKGPGDDRRWFCQYLADREIEASIRLDDKETTIATMLYKDLRCEVIHEAIIDPEKFQPVEGTLVMTKEGFRFGRSLISELLEAIRKDPLQREAFRDLLSRYHNIIEFDGNESKKELWSKLEATYGATGHKLDILEKIVAGLTPETISTMTFAQLATAFKEEVIPNVRDFELVGGQITALGGEVDMSSAGVWIDVRPIYNYSNGLTTAGYEVLKEMCSHYRTVDYACAPG